MQLISTILILVDPKSSNNPAFLKFLKIPEYSIVLSESDMKEAEADPQK